MTMKLLSLQVMRGVAANLVVLTHLVSTETKYSGVTLPAFAVYGIAGVDIFFVLSGFIMVATTGPETSAGRFLWRRAARIFPAYWLVSALVLGVMMILPSWVNASVQGHVSLWRSFLLVPDLELPLLTVGWTLVYEVYFYLVFALLLSLPFSLPLGLLQWGVALIVLRYALGDLALSDPFLRVWTNPLAAEFIAGATAGVAFQRKVTWGASQAAFAGIALLPVSILVVAPALSLADGEHHESARVILFGMPAALIIYGLSAREHRSPMSPPRLLVALGDWSYGTYLVHVLVLSATGRVIQAVAGQGAIPGLLLAVVGIVGANAAGAILFSYFERPTLAFLNQLWPRLPDMMPAKAPKSP